jgi:hypothetical protein
MKQPVRTEFSLIDALTAIDAFAGIRQTMDIVRINADEFSSRGEEGCIEWRADGEKMMFEINVEGLRALEIRTTRK